MTLLLSNVFCVWMELEVILEPGCKHLRLIDILPWINFLQKCY